MDRATFDQQAHLAVPSHGKTTETFSVLTNDENAMLSHLCQHHLRLEQERVSQSWVEQIIHDEKAVVARASSADHIHALFVAVVLCRRSIERPRFVRPSSQLTPPKLVRVILLRNVQRPKIIHRRIKVVATLSAGKIDHVPDQRRLTVGTGSRQRGILDGLDFLGV